MGSIIAIGIVGSVILDLLRGVFFVIDGLVYGLAGLFFQFALEFVNINDFINLSNVLSRVSQVVYSFLAIVMFFKISFSLLQWLIDPDKMADKETGAKKIVINVLICLALIVVVPKVFEVAMDIQDKIIKENIIGETIYGEENIKVNDVGRTLARATWGLFLRPANRVGDINIFVDEMDVWDDYFNISQGVNDDAKAILKLFSSLNAKTVIVAGEYKLTYLFFISTIVGFYLCWTFIKLSIDFAYRAIKMFMLQLISPIAIISYVDPKSSKNGVFAKWLKETTKTYISIFIRIACYSIAALLMNEFATSLYAKKISLIEKYLDIVPLLIYILAIIAFVKNAPKFIDGILGTEISKGSETKFATDMLRGIGGATVGAAAGGIAHGVIAKRVGAPVFKNVVKGAWAAGNKGFSAASKGGFAGMRGVVEAGFGAVSSAKKEFGYNVDKDKEREVEKLMEKVPQVNRAKNNRAAELQENDNAVINSMLREGKKVNGRTYGNALVGDAQTMNFILKNEGGLVAARILHADSPEYMKSKNFAAHQEATAAMVELTYDIAKNTYDDHQKNYAASTDKINYLVSLASDNVKESFTTLESVATREITAYGDKIDENGIKEKVKFISKNTGKDVATLNSMSDEELVREYVNSAISSEYNVNLTGHESDSVENRIAIAVNQVATHEKVKVNSMSTTQLDTEFTKLNDQSIVAQYEHTLGDMAADSAKAKSDAEKAKDALKNFKNDYKGARDKRIDDYYEDAEQKYKENEHAEKQKEREQNNNNNNVN